MKGSGFAPARTFAAMIDPKAASDILIDTILNDKRHTHYKRVNDLREMYRRFITGEGLENDLQHIIQRETEDQFKLRKKLFFPLVPAICHRCDVPFTKVHRALGTIESIEYQGEQSSTKEKALKQAMDGFWGDEDLGDYFSDRFRELNRLDPNAYIMVEFGEFDNVTARAQPYPLEVSSKQAIHWSKTNNRVDWMIGKFDHTMLDSADKPTEGERYVMYFGYILDFRQVLVPDRDPATAFDPTVSTKFRPQLVRIGAKTFECRLLQPFTQGQTIRFQGTQPGHLKDPYTDGETFISYLQHAKNRMMDTLKSGSEHSLIMSLQAHPRIYMYLPTCEGEREEDGRSRICDHGKNPVTGATCKRCAGSGKNIPTSVLDIMYLDMPDGDKPLEDLSKMMHMFSPEVELITAIRDHLRDLEDQAVKDVFTSLQHQRGKVTATATEVKVDSDAMNDALHPYARKVSTSRTLIVEVCAAFVEADKGLQYTHRFPEDFQLTPLSVLLEDLQKAKTADASPMLRELIEDDAVAKKLRDRPFELLQYNVKKKWRPLRHLTQAEILSAVENGTAGETDMVLRNHESAIYLELGRDANFWYRDEQAQKVLIDKEIAKVLQRLKDEKAAQIDFAAEMAGGSGDGGQEDPVPA